MKKAKWTKIITPWHFTRPETEGIYLCCLTFPDIPDRFLYRALKYVTDVSKYIYCKSPHPGFLYRDVEQEKYYEIPFVTCWTELAPGDKGGLGCET